MWQMSKQISAQQQDYAPVQNLNNPQDLRSVAMSYSSQNNNRDFCSPAKIRKLAADNNPRSSVNTDYFLENNPTVLNRKMPRGLIRPLSSKDYPFKQEQQHFFNGTLKGFKPNGVIQVNIKYIVPMGENVSGVEFTISDSTDQCNIQVSTRRADGPAVRTVQQEQQQHQRVQQQQERQQWWRRWREKQRRQIKPQRERKRQQLNPPLNSGRKRIQSFQEKMRKEAEAPEMECCACRERQAYVRDWVAQHWC